MVRMLDGMERMLRGELPPPAAATKIGMRLASFGHGEAVVELDADASHANPMGTVQGGILAAIADAAIGWAYMTTLGEGESYTTLELKLNFLRPGEERVAADLREVGIERVLCERYRHGSSFVLLPGADATPG